MSVQIPYSDGPENPIIRTAKEIKAAQEEMNGKDNTLAESTEETKQSIKDLLDSDPYSNFL